VIRTAPQPPSTATRVVSETRWTGRSIDDRSQRFQDRELVVVGDLVVVGALGDELPQGNEATIRSRALADTQQLRMLERLRSAGTRPVTLGELRGGGIDFPAVVVSELELHGYAIERVYEDGRLIGVRLLSTETSDTPTSRRRDRWRRGSR